MDFSAPWVYIVLLGAVVLVYSLLAPQRKQAARSSQDTVSDVEATLEQYMAEMEQDNDEIVQLLTQFKQDTVSKQLSMQEQISELRQRLADTEKQHAALELVVSTLQQNGWKGASVPGAADSMSAASLPDGATAEPEQQIEEPSPAVPTVRDRYPQLFELDAQGKSMDAIAKAVGMPRGEVQLILQLAKREESL